MNHINALLDPPAAPPRAPAGRSHREAGPLPRPATGIPPATPGRDWLASTSADPAACLAAWRIPNALAPLRIAADSPWHVISTSVRLGDGALQALAAANALPGPTLCTDTHLHFWVPRLTADWHSLLNGVSDTAEGPWAWGTRLTMHLAPGQEAALPCPAPGSVGRRARWIHAPDGSGTLTYAGALADALHQAFRALYAREPASPAPHTKPSDPATRADHFAAFIGRPHRTEAS